MLKRSLIYPFLDTLYCIGTEVDTLSWYLDILSLKKFPYIGKIAYLYSIKDIN